MDNSIGNQATMERGADSAPLGRIDQYELARELGGGGFGTVYLARDTVAGVDVAVKGLPPLVKNSAEELERIRENFALVSRLHHPNIAAALHLHQARAASYADGRARQALRVLPGDTLMVMAYAPGVTLNKWRRQFPEGRVPVDRALEVCRQVASALDYAHGEKVVHRDVKPSNVMVETREGKTPNSERRTLNAEVAVRVLDFGLAAEIRSSMSRVSQEKGDTSGTRPYMAPEQWAGRRQDGRTDQYALAALFYELVSGAVPFASAFDTGDPEIMRATVLKERPEPLPELLKAQNAALLRGLAKEPAERFASCGGFVSAVGGRATPRAAGGRRAALWLAAAGVLCLGAYTSYFADREAVRAAAEQRKEKEPEIQSRDAEAQRGEAEGAAHKVEAEKSLMPTLTVEAEAVGRSVAETISDGERTYTTPHTFELRPDVRYDFTVSVESKRYKPAAFEITADWRGPKTRRVALEVKGPDEGESWVSPSIGMDFVWVPALKLWVGKYEVTNNEYRRMAPEHDSKKINDEHTLNEDRQPVVFLYFEDTTAYANWLTERDKKWLNGLRYRVISEAEWQTCAQCGDGREYPWGNAMPPKRGNYADTAYKQYADTAYKQYADTTLKREIAGGIVIVDGYTDGYVVTCPVEKSGANEWGIYGLGGNVWEGCASDASGSSFGAWRGASFANANADELRCAYREGLCVGGKGDCDDTCVGGFRLVLSPRLPLTGLRRQTH